MRKAALALVTGAVCIGLAPVLPKLAFDLERAPDAATNGAPLGMIAIAFWRMALATPMFWILARRSVGVSAAPTSSRDRLWLALTGVAFAADMAVWHKSFEYTTLANTTLLSNFATILVALAGYFWLKERIGSGFWLGAALALGGAALLLGVDFARGTDPVIGDALGLLTACFYAAYLLLVKRQRGRFSTALVMAYSSSACAVCLLGVTLLAGEGLWPARAESWLLIALLALVSQVGGQGLITYAMAHLPASFATISLLVQPVVTAAVSWILFDQALSHAQLGGCALVLVGIAIAQRASAPGSDRPL